MQSCNITAQIVESVAACSSCTVKVNTMQTLHDVNMIWNFIIWNNWFAKTFYLNVLAVVLTDRNRLVDDVWNNHHTFFDFFGELFFFYFQISQFLSHRSYLCFYLFCFFFLAFCHQSADLFGQGVSLTTQIVTSGFCIAELGVQLQNFVNQNQFFVLEFLFNIFFDKVRVCSDQFDIQHADILLTKIQQILCGK